MLLLLASYSPIVITFAPGTIRSPGTTGAVESPSAAGTLRSPKTSGSIKG